MRGRGALLAVVRLLDTSLLWAVILSVLTWPLSPSGLSPTPGLDPSWQGALAMGASMHLHFGTQIVFTYGPLGFLASAVLYSASTGIAAVIYAFGISACVFYGLIRLLRRRLPMPCTVVLAYVVGGAVLLTGLGTEVSLALGLSLLISLLLRPPSEATPLRWWAVLGVMTGFFPLIKVSLSLGFTVIVVTGIAGVTRDRAKVAATTVGVAMITFLAGWFGTGNGIGNIDPFVRHAISVAVGYSSAMSTDFANRPYIGWMALLDAVLVAALVGLACRGRPQNVRAALIVSSAVVLWLLAKESFIRFDAGHWVVFFAPVPLLIAALLTPIAKWQWIVFAEVTAVTISYVAFGGIPNLATKPVLAVRQFNQEIGTLDSSANLNNVILTARAAMQTDYGIPPEMIRQMTGHTVSVSPWEQNVAWAFPQLQFDPLPVIQDYSAYTSSLDQLDVDDLHSSQAPDFILKQPIGFTIDSRLGSFDPPATQLAIECGYSQVSATPEWELLKREKNRCGRLRAISTVVQHGSGFVTVPGAPKGDDIVATFALSQPLSWRVEGLLLRSPETCLSAEFVGNPVPQTYRFVVGTAGDAHILKAAATTGYGALFTPPTVSALAVTDCGRQINVATTIHFYSIRVSGA